MPISKTKNQYAVYLQLEFVHKVNKTFKTVFLTLGLSPFDLGYDTPQQAEKTAAKVVEKAMERFNNSVLGSYDFDEKLPNGQTMRVSLSPKYYKWWNYLITNTKLIEAKGIQL